MNETFSRIAFAKQEEAFLKLINHQSKLSISRQCELLGLPRSSYYYRPVLLSPDKVALTNRLMECIDRIHTDYPWAGQRKIQTILRNEYSLVIGRKRIRNLMHRMGIQVIYPKVNLSKRNFKESIVPYLLRNYNAYLPNQVWSIDITFIKMYRGHMYLTALIDWYSRKIVGWTLSDSLETENILQVVKEAVSKNGIPAIINSDQGSQFTSTEYRRLLKDLGIRQSMDGKSRWADNIMIERWFRSLKTELIYINEFGSPKELRVAIRDYIEIYNNRRPHESLGNKTPSEVYGSCFAA